MMIILEHTLIADTAVMHTLHQAEAQGRINKYMSRVRNRQVNAKTYLIGV